MKPLIMKKTRRKSRLLLWFSCLLMCLISVNVHADDDVMDSIDEAIAAYKEGRYTEAMGGLDYASRLIGQKRSQMLKTLLPKPLSGWTAESASSESAGLAMLGGILSAKRIYLKGPSRVTVEITDSPALQSIMALFTNLIVNTTGNGRLKRIGGQKAVIKYDSETHNGDITVMIEDRCMLTIKGEDVTEQDLMDYALKIDYKKLKAL